MTSDQKIIVIIYNIAGVLLFIVTIYLILKTVIKDFYGDVGIWRRRFKEAHSFVETPFRCFARPEVYVPTMVGDTVEPIVCSNFWVPPGIVFPDIKIPGVGQRKSNCKAEDEENHGEKVSDDEDDIDHEVSLMYIVPCICLFKS